MTTTSLFIVHYRTAAFTGNQSITIQAATPAEARAKVRKDLPGAIVVKVKVKRNIA